MSKYHRIKCTTTRQAYQLISKQLCYNVTSVDCTFPDKVETTLR